MRASDATLTTSTFNMAHCNDLLCKVDCGGSHSLLMHLFTAAAYMTVKTGIVRGQIRVISTHKFHLPRSTPMIMKVTLAVQVSVVLIRPASVT